MALHEWNLKGVLCWWEGMAKEAQSLTRCAHNCFPTEERQDEYVVTPTDCLQYPEWACFIPAQMCKTGLHRRSALSAHDNPQGVLQSMRRCQVETTRCSAGHFWHMLRSTRF